MCMPYLNFYMKYADAGKKQHFFSTSTATKKSYICVSVLSHHLTLLYIGVG